jgi:hypothetical protein
MSLTVAEPCDNASFCDVGFGHGLWTPMAAVAVGEGVAVAESAAVSGGQGNASASACEGV